MNDATIKTIECMTTWQGEGPNSGSRMLLLRFKQCDRVENGRACRWCDTLVKMRVSMEQECTLMGIQELINKEGAGLMITGGEPTWSHNFESTVSLLNELDYPLANIETNGYKLDELVDAVNPDKPVNFIFSPKFFTIGEVEQSKEQIHAFRNIHNVYFKLVYEENVLMDDYLSHLIGIIPGHRIYLMPEGKDLESIKKHSELVFDAAEVYKVNFSSRDHIVYGFV